MTESTKKHCGLDTTLDAALIRDDNAALGDSQKDGNLITLASCRTTDSELVCRICHDLRRVVDLYCLQANRLREENRQLRCACEEALKAIEECPHNPWIERSLLRLRDLLRENSA